MHSNDFNEAATIARDARRVLHHEYAHFVVARHYGVLSHVMLERNPSGGIDERHFTGHCHFLSRFTSREAEKLTALAGAVAEELLAGVDDAEDIFHELERAENFSDTDREMAGAYDERDVDACVRLVRDVWREIVELVELDLPLIERADKAER